MINSELDFEKYNTIFSNEKIVVIPHFLSNHVAERIYNYIHHEKKKSSWVSSVCFDNAKSDLQYKDSKKKNIQHNIRKANAAFSMEKFAFSFQRTMNDNKPKKPNMEDFTKFLFKQEKVIAKINEITNMNVQTAHDVFLSKYRFGDFLSPHSDKNNGRIAFVLNMTKNWKPHFGGVLHIMNQERTEIVKSVPPSFNSLVLFHIPENTGIPHFVSHVNIQGRYRYAITGWFS
tara:strand:+ start:842 stop:1534 length:693 start_codon:yes stop_codon:yes gene_type:complete